MVWSLFLVPVKWLDSQLIYYFHTMVIIWPNYTLCNIFAKYYKNVSGSDLLEYINWPIYIYNIYLQLNWPKTMHWRYRDMNTTCKKAFVRNNKLLKHLSKKKCSTTKNMESQVDSVRMQKLPDFINNKAKKFK